MTRSVVVFASACLLSVSGCSSDDPEGAPAHELGDGGAGASSSGGGLGETGSSSSGGASTGDAGLDATTAAGDAGDAGSVPGARAMGPQPVAQTPLADGTVFAAPNGSGTSCTQAAPCDVWQAAAKAKAGDVVFLRGGTYPISKNLILANQGTSAAPVIYESYPGEAAVLDGSQHTKGSQIHVRLQGKFVQLRRLEVKSMPMRGILITGTDNLLDGVHAHHNGLTGIQLWAPQEAPYATEASRNTLRNCTANDNSDAGLPADGGNADGIGISSGADNRVENCLVYANSDDGIDTWASTGSYVGYNISHHNGLAKGNGRGIKAGGAAPSANTTVERCLSYSNTQTGIDYNGVVGGTFRNNTTWDNRRGYALGSDTVAIANIAAETRSQEGTGISTNNSWGRSGTPTFLSTDPASPDFLRPSAGGGFEDIGAYAD